MHVDVGGCHVEGKVVLCVHFPSFLVSTWAHGSHRWPPHPLSALGSRDRSQDSSPTSPFGQAEALGPLPTLGGLPSPDPPGEGLACVE